MHFTIRAIVRLTFAKFQTIGSFFQIIGGSGSDLILGKQLMSESKASDLTEFLQSVAGDFFAIPDSRPADFESKGRTRSIKIYVDDGRPATLAFFRNIMELEPERFARLNRAFHDTQIGLHGVGWAITRFAGGMYLSLSVGTEIYVRRLPAQVCAAAITAAQRFDRFLDCAVSTGARDDSPWSMPLRLAQSLQSPAGMGHSMAT